MLVTVNLRQLPELQYFEGKLACLCQLAVDKFSNHYPILSAIHQHDLLSNLDEEKTCERMDRAILLIIFALALVEQSRCHGHLLILPDGEDPMPRREDLQFEAAPGLDLYTQATQDAREALIDLDLRPAQALLLSALYWTQFGAKQRVSKCLFHADRLFQILPTSGACTEDIKRLHGVSLLLRDAVGNPLLESSLQANATGMNEKDKRSEGEDYWSLCEGIENEEITDSISFGLALKLDGAWLH